MREEHVRRTVPSLAYLTDEGEPFAFVLSPKCFWLASFGTSGQGSEGGREGAQSRCIYMRRSEGS